MIDIEYLYSNVMDYRAYTHKPITQIIGNYEFLHNAKSIDVEQIDNFKIGARFNTVHAHKEPTNTRNTQIKAYSAFRCVFDEKKPIEFLEVQKVSAKQHKNNIAIYSQYLKDFSDWEADRHSLNNLRHLRNKIALVQDIKKLKRKLAQSKNLLKAALQYEENVKLINEGKKPKYNLHTIKLDIENSNLTKKLEIAVAYKDIMLRQIPKLEQKIQDDEFDLSRNLQYKSITDKIKDYEFICKTYVQARRNYIKFFNQYACNDSKNWFIWEFENKRYQVKIT